MGLQEGRYIGVRVVDGEEGMIERWRTEESGRAIIRLNEA